MLLRVAKEMDVIPTAGVRIGLDDGRRAVVETAGERASLAKRVAAVCGYCKLEAAGRLDILKMIHFHMGSQIPIIRNIKQRWRRSRGSTSARRPA